MNHGHAFIGLEIGRILMQESCTRHAENSYIAMQKVTKTPHVHVCMYMYNIYNWPLSIRAFQDQCKQTMINKYSNIAIPVRGGGGVEGGADQIAIREVELGLLRTTSASDQRRI